MVENGWYMIEGKMVYLEFTEEGFKEIKVTPTPANQ